MKQSIAISILVLGISVSGFAQVDEIKSASKSSGGGGRGEGGSSGGGSFVVDLFFNVFIGELIEGQRQKLQTRDENPGVVSLDLHLQAALQPSSYYIVQPRLRANWALFSTDYRINYVIEDDVEGMKHIRTNEWQILQFNIVNKKDVVFRVGGGFIQENYGLENTVGEWTTAIQVHPSTSKIGGFFEFREAEIRREFSAYAQYRLFDQGRLHGLATLGFVHQRYYSAVNTWGVQGGVIFRLY